MRMGDLDAEALALGLTQYLPLDIVNSLKEQCVTGESFMGLNAETLKMCGFPLGHIMKIMKVVSQIKDGIIAASQEMCTAHKSLEDGGDNSEDSTKEDDILSEFLDEEYLKTLPLYLKTNMCGRVERWKDLIRLNLPHGHRPDLSVPNKVYWKDRSTSQTLRNKGNSEESKQRTQTISQSSSRKRKPSMSSDDEETHESEDEEGSDSDSDGETRGGEAAKEKVIWYAAPALLKTKEELQALSPSLPQYEIETVLEDDENSKQRTKHFVPYLKEGKLLGSKERKRVFRKLGLFLCFKAVDNPNKATATMREGLAKSISHIWNKKGGHLANIIKRIQTNLPDSERAKKGKVVKKKKAKVPTCNVNIQELNLLLPATNRLEIFDGMKKTYPLRCAARAKSISITDMLKEYEHFKHFNGELIALEYSMMHPNSKDMCPELSKFVPKIIVKWTATQGARTEFPDDNMKACLILACKLPHTINGRSSVPKESEIVVTVKPGVNLENFVVERRQSQRKAVQPYSDAHR
ncbi:Nesprin-1, partial [Frankliniella fusca]